MKTFLILIVSLSFALSANGQAPQKSGIVTNTETKNLSGLAQLKKTIIGKWLEGTCSGAEVWTNFFDFYGNGTFKYILGDVAPNPLSSINGYYEIFQDTGSRFILKLRVASITLFTWYSIDADGNAPSPGIFGFNAEKTKTINQKDSIFHDHILKICNTVKEGNGSDIICPCIEIDLWYKYYRISDSK